MRELKMDRSDLPELPRPAWQIGAALCDDGDVRLWIQGDQSVRTRTIEIGPGSVEHILHMAEQWFVAQHEFAVDEEAWRRAVAIAARRIAEHFASPSMP